MQDHSGMAGGFTWRIGWHFEVGSPKQVQFGGKETLTLGPQSQVPTLGLEPPSGQDVFFWVPFCTPKQPSARSLREGCYRCICKMFEVLSPQLVQWASMETLQSSTQSQLLTLRLNLSFWSFVCVDTLSPK